ncbi:MAG: hypothetical protein IT423_16465 [Pirellulaceae bacterium]|nr:hypothetical protein [Pirellulaceae bacterium]
MKSKLAYWTLSAFGLTLLLQSTAAAHFPWLVRDADNKAQLFFGEGLNERTYKLPPSIAQAEVHQLDEQGRAIKLSTKAVDEKEFVGLTSAEQIPSHRILASSVTYGVFRGSKLQYTALSYGKLATDAKSIKLPSDLVLQAKVLDTDSGISVQVNWDGQPLSKAKVTLYDAQGAEGGEVETDASGIALFTEEQIHGGWNAIRVGHTISKEGKLGDEPFSGEMHYLTSTFQAPEVSSTPEIAELPFAVTSFGAATDGKALYVFGGHMGEAHSYSEDGQSDKLLRLELSGNKKEWQEIATGKRLQGTAMVAYGDELIVVGGFQARNKAGESKNLHSLADVRSFNTQTKTWSELPALPEPRSSHDAALIGSTVYVVGGWQMAGDADTIWHKTSWKMDLASTSRRWEALPNPPFERRALATIEHGGKLVVIGGMDQAGSPTKAVAMFDPVTQAWKSLPDIQGEKSMAGFGVSGWSVNGKLVVTSQEGKIEELVNGDTWKVVGETKDARFFHRVLPIGGGKLVALGGANMSIGKFTESEVISVHP